MHVPAPPLLNDLHRWASDIEHAPYESGELLLPACRSDIRILDMHGTWESKR